MVETHYVAHLAEPEKPIHIPPAPPKRVDEVKNSHLLVRLIRWLVFGPQHPKYLGEWVYSERDRVWRFHVPVWDSSSVVHPS